MISNQYVEPGREDRQRLWQSLALVVFLLPISPYVGEARVSANYSYLALLYFLRPLRSWPRLIWLVAGYAVFCYLWGMLFIANAAPDFYSRQLISFLLFLGPLLISVVKLPFDFATFARVTALVATAYSVWVVIALIATGTPITLAWATLIDWVPDWPQRFVIVGMVGFFLALLLARQSPRWLFAGGLCGFCVIVSHGRASYLAMLCAVMLLAFLYLRARDWKSLKYLGYSLLLMMVWIAAFSGMDSLDLLASETKNVTSGILQTDLLQVVSALRLEEDVNATINRVVSLGGRGIRKHPFGDLA